MIEFPFPPNDATPSVREWMSKARDWADEKFKFGVGSPETNVTANIGCIYINTEGGASTTLYVKESGTNTNTGWAAK